jgi:hypothetical protein
MRIVVVGAGGTGGYFGGLLGAPWPLRGMRSSLYGFSNRANPNPR